MNIQDIKALRDRTGCGVAEARAALQEASGDLDRAACLRAAAIQKRKALARAQKARFYHAVAQRLADGQTVRDALGDDALARLFTEAAR